MALINGILLEEKSIQGLGSHVDLPTLQSMVSNKDPKDFGLIDLYANKHYKDVPLYAGMLMNGALTVIDGDSYTFSLPTANDVSTKIIENPNKTPKLGEGGSTFTLVTNNNNLGGYGAVVTFDKMGSSPELEVVGVRNNGNKFTYSFRIVPGSIVSTMDSVPSEFLAPGTKLFKLAGFGATEFGQNYDSFSFSGGVTEKKYIKQLSTAKLKVHYDFTKKAVEFSNNPELSRQISKNIKHFEDSVIAYNFMAGGTTPLDPQIVYMKDYKGDSTVAASGLIYTLDHLCVKILAKYKSEYNMWGKGGFIAQGDSFEGTRAPIGIYHQADKAGYKDEYDLNTFGIHTLQNAYRRFTSGHVPVVEHGMEPVIRMRTGKGGLELVSPLIEKYALSSLGGYQQQADALNIITGTAESGLGVNKPFYNKLRLPGVAVFVFDYEPSFDPTTDTNELFNPLMHTGYRLSSYTFLMDDAAFSDSNIKLLRRSETSGQIEQRVVSRTATHPFFKNTYMGHNMIQSTGNGTGFSSYFETEVDTPWLIDPTRMLKLVPKNPKLTNFSL